MAFSLNHVPDGSLDYETLIDANWSAIEAAINSLVSQITATSGDGPLLTLESYDRDGIVGAASYVLDVPAYTGGPTIKIGRRPAWNIVLGDKDLSVAWMTAAGVKHRVFRTGDVTLSAAGVIAGLPKTIYIGIPSSGMPQIFPDTTTLNVLYIYSMRWDGFNLSAFQRLAPILSGYTTLQALAAKGRILQHYDPDTDFLAETEARVDLVVPGAADDNEIGVDLMYEILGFMVTFHRNDADGLYAPFGAAPDNEMTLEARDENGLRWNLEDIIFDASSVPATIYSAVDKAAVGDDRFVTEAQVFTLVRTQIGSAVISARGFTFGVILRPLIGAETGKNDTTVDQL